VAYDGRDVRAHDTFRPEVAARRLAAQQIARHERADAGALVASLGAIQAQDYAGSRWALALRLAGSRVGEPTVARALADGTVIRTHALRWTWQLVAPADLHWMLPLVAPRLHARAAGRHRRLGLDAPTFRRAEAALARALRGGDELTRAELAAALRDAGVNIEAERLSHVLGTAELNAVICSGSPRGARPTYALLERRAPRPSAPLSRADALAELARRYFRGRGPATLADFVWWSGLTVTDARAALAAVETELAGETFAGVKTWRAARAPLPTAAALARAYLLPPFDEYLVGYRDRSAVLAERHVRRLNAGGGLLAPCIVLGGRVVGTWRRVLDRAGVTVTLAPFQPLPRADRARVEEAAERYAAFLGRRPRVVTAA
jgi:hypothetical protein